MLGRPSPLADLPLGSNASGLIWTVPPAHLPTSAVYHRRGLDGADQEWTIQVQRWLATQTWIVGGEVRRQHHTRLIGHRVDVWFAQQDAQLIHQGWAPALPQVAVTGPDGPQQTARRCG
ncbi:hypothetical protein Misp03_35800 [Microbispora sp. NBRC 16548]|nr:hypothetical protein Misp03_35800 [Microbispora sp. NBRC 16548]